MANSPKEILLIWLILDNIAPTSSGVAAKIPMCSLFFISELFTDFLI